METLFLFLYFSIGGIGFTYLFLREFGKENKLKNWEVYLLCVIWPISEFFAACAGMIGIVLFIREEVNKIWRKGFVFYGKKIIQHLRDDFRPKDNQL